MFRIVERDRRDTQHSPDRGAECPGDRGDDIRTFATYDSRQFDAPPDQFRRQRGSDAEAGIEDPAPPLHGRSVRVAVDTVPIGDPYVVAGDPAGLAIDGIVRVLEVAEGEGLAGDRKPNGDVNFWWELGP